MKLTRQGPFFQAALGIYFLVPKYPHKQSSPSLLACISYQEMFPASGTSVVGPCFQNASGQRARPQDGVLR